MPGMALDVSIHLILTTPGDGPIIHYPYFTDEKTEAQREVK